MSEKRSKKIMDAVLERVSDVISHRYNINKNDIIDNIKNIPESFKCNHTLTKGKRKGQSCGVVLCSHHPEQEYKLHKVNNIDDMKDDITVQNVYIPDPHYTQFMDINGDEKHDSDMADAIQDQLCMQM